MRALALVLVGACAGQHHVQLTGPAPGITPEQRVAMFWQHRPVGQGFMTESGKLLNTTLMLADTTEIVSPEDLAPLVGARSETMRAARASVAARRKADIAWKITVAMMVGGTVMNGMMMTLDTPFGISPWIGWSSLLGGFLVAYPITRRYSSIELRLRREAFASYPRDLGLQLDVCAQGVQVVPCEAPHPAPPASPPGPRIPVTTVPARTATLQMR